MNRLQQLFTFTAVALLALAAGLYFRTGAVESATAPPTPPGLMDAALADLKGVKTPLGTWKGKVLVINFWATWCAPCRKEIPAFIRMQQKLGPRGLQFVGVAIDEKDKVALYAREMGINYPILVGELDAVELSRSLGNQLGALPFTVIVDRAGKVVKTELGGVDEARLTQLIQPLLQ